MIFIYFLKCRLILLLITCLEYNQIYLVVPNARLKYTKYIIIKAMYFVQS